LWKKRIVIKKKKNEEEKEEVCGRKIIKIVFLGE